jgi:hypothetical protein
MWFRLSSDFQYVFSRGEVSAFFEMPAFYIKRNDPLLSPHTNACGRESLNILPHKGESAILRQLQLKKLSRKMAPERSLFALVADDEHIASIRIDERDVLDSGKFSIRCDDLSAAPDGPRVMFEGPVLSAAGKLAGFGIDRDDAGALKGSDIR